MAEDHAARDQSALPKDSSPKILVLVEQPPVAELIKLTLHHGAGVARNVSAPEAIAVLEEWKPDLAVLQVEVAGDEVLQRVTGATAAPAGIPVLGLTRHGDLKTKLAAFEKGMEDIMTVPFSPEELLARVLVIERRHAKQPILVPVVKIGGMELDILRRQVRLDEEDIHLTGMEQSLLYLFAANAGRVLSRNQIRDAIWGPDFVADSHIVDRQVLNLRVKLQNNYRRPRFISTIPKQGYLFSPA